VVRTPPRHPSADGAPRPAPAAAHRDARHRRV